jgi:phosphoserine phosphatase
MISRNAKPVNEFSPELWSRLSGDIERAISEYRGPRIAAFDADGTLWDNDAGETFFDYQIRHCDLKGLPADPWEHYHALKQPDPRIAYVWLAQISAGHSLERVREWASECFKKFGSWPVFDSQRRLIEMLRQHDFEIYIVTASIKWAVEPVAGLVGVDNDHVIGITTRIENGKVGMEPLHPITWREGKAEGLLAATKGVRPLLACGNTYGDTHLLESATHVRLAVSTQNEPGGLFDEETKLLTEATARGWLRHAFRTR